MYESCSKIAVSDSAQFRLPDGSIRAGEECYIYTSYGMAIRGKWDPSNPFYIAYHPLIRASREVKDAAKNAERLMGNPL